MDRKRFLKIIGLIAVLVLVANMILFALRIINGLVFWAVIIVGAVFAFKVLPKMKK
ncbi:hypothetical protein HYV87_00630 [Candidatus Woesearchaeota archaeon]|nr:hypothetical protein [Candidatus Woesearchaeota archaeon]